MIDITDENLIPILDVLNLIPVSKPTLRRWTASGKLETVRAGAKVFTTHEAVQRFIKQGPQPIQAPPLPPTRKQQRRSVELALAHREAEALLRGRVV